MNDWKRVPGYDDHYVVNKNGDIKSLYVNRLLTKYDSSGYYTVHIKKIDGTKTTARVHRLVAIAFLGNKKDLYVNHINGNKKDNRLENLQWVTPSENTLHSYYELDNGNETMRGERLTDSEKREIVKQHECGVKIKDTLNQFNISISLYRRITDTQECNIQIGTKTNFDLLDREEIKKVEGYDNYWVSNFGNVYSSNKGDKLILHNRNGYKGVCLYRSGLFKNCYVHRLVAKHFVDNPDNKKYVNHINENKTDNRASNLEWATRKENLSHSMHKTRTVSDDEIRKVKRMVCAGYSIKSIARKLKISKTTIGRIIHCKGRFKEKRKTADIQYPLFDLLE
jgi:hypothetical protein